MEEAAGLQVELIPGAGGIFEVIVDGDLLYDKAATGSFPNPGELATLLKDKGLTS